jgi:hypothetical protein
LSTSDQSATNPAGTSQEQPVISPNKKEDRQLLTAFQTIFGVVPRIGSAVIGLVAIGYFIGWRTSESYFGAFGAGWVSSLLSPIELLQRSYPPLSGLIVGILLAVVNTLNGTWTKKGIQRADTVTSVGAVTLLCIALLGDKYIGLVWTGVAAMSASLLFSLCIGFSIALHAFALRDQGQQWRGSQMGLIYFLWIIAATQLPLTAGESPGHLAADPEKSRLPIARLGSEDWRLLLARSDRFVLAKLSKDGQPPIIKIVPAEQVDFVHEIK